MLIGSGGARPILADGSRASAGNQKRSIAENVTAHTGSSQGDGPITTDIVQIAVCANAGDALTLPPIVKGMLITIENDGANSADVFPATGGNINGGGANLAEALPAGEFVTYYAIDGVNWSTLSKTGGGGGGSDFALLAGRAGGQTLIGGTGAGETLTLQSTSHGTRGKILFGTSAYDEVNNRLGLGTATPDATLHVVGAAKITGSLTGGGSGHDQFSDFVPDEHLLPSAISHDDLIAGTIASHDTGATGAELDALTNDSMADALHRHSELSASDGSPSPVLAVTAIGRVGITNSDPLTPLCLLHVGVSPVVAAWFSGGPADGLIVATGAITRLAIAGATQAELIMYDSGAAEDEKTFRMVNGAGTTRLEILNDIFTVIRATPLSIDMTQGNVGIGLVNPKTQLTVEGALTLKERANADGDTAAYGQLWVKTATPNELWFTDDAGTDHQVAYI